ncbi:hypothetical protein B1748_02775 [Paenibacillus sp. MY03]|jgi:LacI family transcriptional regulator|uniref:LacI family DNA-binding transcriptional regulator n=1 Tax=Paenibacillus sp. MY03 TaxID=302980 RepID=UPI000B3CFB28|nr:substrate-binding domain-containing protein [Paenibacillus sp. MY03]OUS77725.1 hypothetical protein B1748_02775 [Paenibacillus sp. MY03]
MSVTIRQIAVKAGVSRGTVDRVLNDRPGVKPHVREKVMAIAEELNYVPNAAAKALAFSKKPLHVGIIMPPREIEFFQEIRDGIEEAADELKGFGIQLEYCYVSNQNPEEGAAVIRKLVKDGVNGIMFSVMDDDLIRLSINQAVDSGVPVITFNSDVEQSKRICFVGQNLPQSGRIAAGLMARVLRSPSKVLVVAGHLSIYAHRARVKGFGDHLSGSGIDIVQVIEGYDRFEDTYEKLKEALTRYPEIEGIYMATGHIGACMDVVKGMNRPNRYRIIANDLMPEVEQGMREGLIDFTIVQNPAQQGYRSLRMLYELILNGKMPEQQYYYTETSIVIPESL